ncbi:MAG: peptide chain release factor N(5)-glutamine methyltransferase [Deltaproteobacteria bacterium]|nr:peptide chain release factor N(5)-glutamine methyltransferase [Deltaproteobacteria bacterium]
MSGPQASWTILATLRWTTDYFRTKGVSEPRAAAEVLLAHTLSVSRLDLYLRYDQPLNPEELARFKALMVRRREGEPVAYLTGHREFWSLDIRVTPAVLIPRPETETLVASALEAAESVGAGLKPAPTMKHHPKTQNLKPKTSPLWGAEVGVGSGAVVIALAKELPSMAWVGLDRSGAALAVARDNARRHAVLHRVHFLQADLLAGLKPFAAFALLVANLPYVPRAEWESLPREIKAFEPPGALLGGEDGLDLIRPLIRQAQQYVKGGGWVLLEVGDQQAPQVAALVEETGAYDRIETIKDFNGMERVVRARRRDGTG